MIPLEKAAWREFRHAYGSADDMPELLRQLADFPPEIDSRTEPFYSLWSALCHQDDVYSASYAAIPHIVSCVDRDPKASSLTYFTLPTAIEIGRARNRGPAISEELRPEYFSSLGRLAELAEAELKHEKDALRIRYLRGAIAAGRGDIDLAERIIDPDDEA